MRASAVRMIVIAGLLAVGVAYGAPARADEAQQAAASETDDANTVICKNEAPATGSRLGTRRVCHTKAQWDQMRQDAREAVEQQQLRGLPTTSGN